jgi:hypothetical protein
LCSRTPLVHPQHRHQLLRHGREDRFAIGRPLQLMGYRLGAIRTDRLTIIAPLLAIHSLNRHRWPLDAQVETRPRQTAQFGCTKPSPSPGGPAGRSPRQIPLSAACARLESMLRPAKRVCWEGVHLSGYDGCVVVGAEIAVVTIVAGVAAVG